MRMKLTPLRLAAGMALLFTTSASAQTVSIFQTLDVPGSIASGAEGTDGNSIAGYYTDSGNLEHGYVYNSGSFTTIDDPSGVDGTLAFSVSGSNVIGLYFDSGNVAHGFLYNGSSYTTLDFPGAGNTSADGISGGNIVGDYHSDTYHGYIYNGTGYTTFDHPGAATGPDQGSDAVGISGNNIVGDFVDSGNIFHGYFYDGSAFTTLDDPATSNFTIAIGVDNANVVGAYEDSGSVQHGFYYSNGNFTNFDYPGSIRTVGEGISGDLIVGIYTAGDGSKHGFTATVIPEPGIWPCLAGFLAMGIAGWQRHRNIKKQWLIHQKSGA